MRICSEERSRPLNFSKELLLSDSDEPGLGEVRGGDEMRLLLAGAGLDILRFSFFEKLPDISCAQLQLN